VGHHEPQLVFAKQIRPKMRFFNLRKFGRIYIIAKGLSTPCAGCAAKTAQNAVFPIFVDFASSTKQMIYLNRGFSKSTLRPLFGQKCVLLRPHSGQGIGQHCYQFDNTPGHFNARI
jgi:hypothetical protein